MIRSIAFVLIFFLIGAFMIVGNHDIHLGVQEESAVFYSLCFDWMSGLFDNFKSVTSYVIKAGWLPNNSTSNISG